MINITARIFTIVIPAANPNLNLARDMKLSNEPVCKISAVINLVLSSLLV